MANCMKAKFVVHADFNFSCIIAKPNADGKVIAACDKIFSRKLKVTGYFGK
jgi:hypothetical protein